MKLRSSNQPVCRSWFVEAPRATPKFPVWSACLLLLASAARTAGADIDAARLPPAAATEADFDRDIRPIFEQSCLRCHGPERPKSHFRLTSREAALKGGDKNPDDIVPGDSAHSHLIHYVSGLVEDMQMPPEDKGKPLASTQIGLLRAWIDQGANWSATNQFFPRSPFSVASTLRWVGVQGGSSKFRELEGIKGGWSGGSEQFSIEEQDTPDTKLSLNGHVLSPEQDLQFKLLFTKTDFGFVRAGYENWRKYYDDSGGYYRPFSPPSFSLDRGLYLDIGRAWVDFGLTLPNLPQLVVGYEYQFKNGAKSMLEWGSVNGKKIYPAAKDINERTDILKVDLSHDWLGWRLEDNVRLEFHTDSTMDRQSAVYTTGPAPDAAVNTGEQASHVQGVNTFRFEKQLKDWWFFSGGYLYSRFNGDSSMNQATTDPLNNPVAGTFWSGQITLRRTMNDFSLATILLPLDGLSLSLGVQCEFSSQEGFGNINLDQGDPNAPNLFALQPAAIQSDLNETKVSENAQLRYTKIPFTVLFAEGRFAQDSISQFEQEAGNTPDVFLRDTDYGNRTGDYRAGFNTSPWRWLALNAHFRRTDSDSDYNNLRDGSPLGGDGYSAFLMGRKMGADEAQTKLVLHPASWLKTTLTYQWTDSDYHTTTDPASGALVSPGGQVLAGRYQANVYGLGLTFIPSHRLYFSGTFTYSDSRVITWAQGVVPSIVVPCQGNIYSVIAGAHYTLNDRTSVQMAYSFSQAGYGQNNYGGLPLGIDYTRNGLTAGVTCKLTKTLSSNLRYQFYDYREPSSGGVNNFTAQGVFATLMFAWR